MTQKARAMRKWVTKTQENRRRRLPSLSATVRFISGPVIVPTVTCDDAAALSIPAPGTVHLICVDPPYYNNVQYAELSNFSTSGSNAPCMTGLAWRTSSVSP